ncbi:MAG: hypothetical protein KKF89_04230, partial [Nanoarchaeota archaeon]|nr:hypothetical protein [Nanoarchaeota archaeon]
NKLLLGRSWSNRLLRKRPKDMILLLDEVQGLNSKEQADIMALYKQGYFRSVCLVAKVRNEVKLTKEFLKLIGKNLFKLKNLSAVESIDLVRKRIGNDQLLSDTIIKKVHRLNPNPRALLENCEDLCRIAFENDSDKVADAHLKLLKK